MCNVDIPSDDLTRVQMPTHQVRTTLLLGTPGTEALSIFTLIRIWLPNTKLTCSPHGKKGSPERLEAQTILGTFGDLGQEIIHQPPYSPNLVPSNILFHNLKKKSLNSIIFFF